MRILLVLLFVAVSLPARAGEDDALQRCGWIDNPTPGNFYLNDRDGSWEIAMQGGYEAPGMALIPDLSGDQFVDIGPHGYACGCMDVEVDADEKRVTAIYAVEQKKLKDCLADPDLPYMQR